MLFCTKITAAMWKINWVPGADWDGKPVTVHGSKKKDTELEFTVK